MPITSNNSKKIFWSIYPHKDDLYWSPYRTGVLNKGETQQLAHSQGLYKLKIQLDNELNGVVFLSPGRIFQNSDVIVVNESTLDVNVVVPPEVPEKPAEEKPKDEKPKEEKPKKKGRLKKFFDFIFDRD